MLEPPTKTDTEQLDLALQHYEEVLQTTPKAVDALIGKGQVLFHKELYQEACDCYNKVLEISPGNIKVLEPRAQAYAKRYQSYQDAAAEATSRFNDENDVTSLIAKAHTQKYLGHLMNRRDPFLLWAFINYSAALKREPNNKEALMGWVQTCSTPALQGKFNASEAPDALKRTRYRAVLDLKITDTETLEAILKGIEGWDEREKQKIKQEISKLFEKQGNNLHSTRKYDEALQYYNRAIEVDPQNADALIKRGYTHIAIHSLLTNEDSQKYKESIQEHLSKAKESYERALQVRPTPLAALGIVNVYQLQGDSASALQWQKKAEAAIAIIRKAQEVPVAQKKNGESLKTAAPAPNEETTPVEKQKAPIEQPQNSSPAPVSFLRQNRRNIFLMTFLAINIVAFVAGVSNSFIRDQMEFILAIPLGFAAISIVEIWRDHRRRQNEKGNNELQNEPSTLQVNNAPPAYSLSSPVYYAGGPDFAVQNGSSTDYILEKDPQNDPTLLNAQPPDKAAPPAYQPAPPSYPGTPMPPPAPSQQQSEVSPPTYVDAITKSGDNGNNSSPSQLASSAVSGASAFFPQKANADQIMPSASHQEEPSQQTNSDSARSAIELTQFERRT